MILNSLRALARPTLLSLSFLLVAQPGHASIEYSDTQRDTIIELVEQLEENHYSKLPYDDTLSAQHLDAYIDALDGGKMFFTAQDIAEFQQYRNSMDDELPKGNLDAGYTIFNRFQKRLETRLESLIETMPERVAAMNFTIDEQYELDLEDREWASTTQELDDRWRKHLKNQVLSLKLADKEEEDIPETLTHRYQNQLNRVKQYNNQDVFQIYANALTELYDPHTNYFSPRRSENFNINMRLSLEGIGAVLQAEDEYTKVARLVPKGPADKQGELKPSDRIVGVGQDDEGKIVDVIGWRLDDVVDLIRGPKGSTVRLQVMPAKALATDERKLITIVRNEVKLEEQAAQKKVLEIPSGDKTLKIGVIDIPAFYIDFEAMRRGDENYKSTTRDVSRLLDELQSEGIDGLVIDLRNNGGGSLQEANELTGLFIEYGPTVQIRHSSRRVWRDGKRLKSNFYDGPLSVLINRLSASASEIFAGAIQDYERGLIVGDRSFGKGTVQTLTPLTEGQLKITESKFYRISGDSTQHRGVIPDIAFPSLYDDEEIGESALDHALPWDQINPVRHRRYDDLSTVLPRLTTLFESRSHTNPDFIYLEDQIGLAAENRKLKSLPLNEEARKAMREKQKAEALSIENKHRVAIGEEPLESLETEDEEAAEDELAVEAGESLAEGEEEDEEDVLLTEAGNVLVDAVIMKQERYAVHAEKE